MATYVFSDVHGHVRALSRVLERVSPNSDDTVFCLGDLIDRGPEPLLSIQLVRELAEAAASLTVLLGNHEDMLLAAQKTRKTSVEYFSWISNGGNTTEHDLAKLSRSAKIELLNWMEELPRYAVHSVCEQIYLLVHAGIKPNFAREPSEWTETSARVFLAAQKPEDLLWIRDGYWNAEHALRPDNLGRPLIISGHTPTPYLSMFGVEANRNPIGENQLARMVWVGDERLDIDAGAAGGAGFGQVLLYRIDDAQEFYEPLLPNE